MVTAVTTAIGNYAESVYYYTVDSTGYMKGGTATAPTAGNATGSPMLRLYGLQDFPFSGVGPDKPTQRMDGGAGARFLNKSTELPESTMTFGAYDMTFDALVQSLAVVTYGGGRIIGRQPYDPTYADMGLLAISQSKDLSGNSMWDARLIYKVNVSSMGRNSFNDEELGTYTYDMVANYATTYPWGTAFVAGTDGDTKFVYGDMSFPYRPIWERWTGNNALVTFNITKNVAEDSTDNLVCHQDGVALTWVTGVPGAGEFGITAGTPDTIVFGTAPTDGAKIVLGMGWS